MGRTNAQEELTPSILPKQMGLGKAAAFPRREEGRKAEEALPERKRAPSKWGGGYGGRGERPRKRENRGQGTEQGELPTPGHPQAGTIRGGSCEFPRPIGQAAGKYSEVS